MIPSKLRGIFEIGIGNLMKNKLLFAAIIKRIAYFGLSNNAEIAKPPTTKNKARVRLCINNFPTIVQPIKIRK